MREGVDTGDIKVIDAKLEGMNLRLDEIIKHTKALEGAVSRAKGFAASLNKDLEIRVRALEVDLERTKTRVMGLIALGSFIIGPVLTWALQKL
jgi:hypothetical protein